MLHKLMAVALLGLCSLVHADTIGLSWVAPLLYADGSVLAAGDITGYIISYMIDGVAYANAVVDVGSATSSTLPAIVGEYTIAIATTTADAVSAFSDPITFDVDALPALVPEAPATLDMVISCAPTGCTLEIK